LFPEFRLILYFCLFDRSPSNTSIIAITKKTLFTGQG
jgi:hypothetical protein